MVFEKLLLTMKRFPQLCAFTVGQRRTTKFFGLLFLADFG